MTVKRVKPELLSPAGDRERLEAAVTYGADAVYLAGKSFGMRSAPANFGEEELRDFWAPYFDLEGDYGAYKKRIDPADAYLVRAADFGRGIRILKQDLWEMIVSFLISQQNNIPRIRRCIANICERYGERRQNSQERTYDTFPRPEALAKAREEDLRDCNLGYRSRYIKKTARMVMDGEISLEAVRNMKYPEAREELLKLYGVGEKVADCICLFALHQMEAFPVDTHIRQALEKHYPQGFPFDRYKDCSGVMQQYIFYYDLKNTVKISEQS